MTGTGSPEPQAGSRTAPTVSVIDAVDLRITAATVRGVTRPGDHLNPNGGTVAPPTHPANAVLTLRSRALDAVLAASTIVGVDDVAVTLDVTKKAAAAALRQLAASGEIVTVVPGRYRAAHPTATTSSSPQTRSRQVRRRVRTALANNGRGCTLETLARALDDITVTELLVAVRALEATGRIRRRRGRLHLTAR